MAALWTQTVLSVTNCSRQLFKCSPLDLSFDTSDQTILLVRLKHRVTTSVLTVSLQPSIHCIYRNISFPCRRSHLQGCSFFTLCILLPRRISSHLWEFRHPAAHLFKARWPPTVSAVRTTASLDINSSGAKQSSTGSETWDQYPGGSAASSLVMHSSKHSCHRHGWEAGEGSCIVAALVTSTGWLEKLLRGGGIWREWCKPLHILHPTSFLLMLRNWLTKLANNTLCSEVKLLKWTIFESRCNLKYFVFPS